MVSHTAVDLKRLHHGHVGIHEVGGMNGKLILPNRQNKIRQYIFRLYSEQIAKHNSGQYFVVYGTVSVGPVDRTPNRQCEVITVSYST